MDPTSARSAGTSVLAQRRSVNTVLAVGLLSLSVIVLLIAAGKVSLLNYAIPVLATVVGATMYWCTPVMYIGYAWWVWFVSALVRRMVDYHVGFTDPSPILLSPYLVSGLAVMTLLPSFGKLFRRRYFPYLLALVSILYGYALGAAVSGVFTATFELLKWIVPVIFAVHLTLRWDRYPGHRRVTESVFTWGILFMGVYGIVQYFVLPEWDKVWMENVDLASLGLPRPMLVRVFSTVNSSGPFAYAMMAGLIVLFNRPGVQNLIVAGPSYVGFLLSLTRSAWGGWFMGLALLVTRLTGPLRTRLIQLMVLGAITMAPLLVADEISGTVTSRMGTITNLEEDTSFQARIASYQGVTGYVIKMPVGYGIGALNVLTGGGTAVDSGVLTVMVELGLPGAFCYFIAIYLLFKPMVFNDRLRHDSFSVICMAIAFGMIGVLFFGKAYFELGGAILWSFLALAHSADTYYERTVPGYEEAVPA